MNTIVKEVIQHEPWFMVHSGKLLMASFVLLLASVLGLIPSPMTAAIEKLSKEHAHQADIQKVQCVHEADWWKDVKIRKRKQQECIEPDTVRLDP